MVAEATRTLPQPLTRREFLFHIWAASMAVALAGSAGAILWFAYPRFREGEFGGTFRTLPANLPAIGAPPEDHPEGRYWLVNTSAGVLALYKVCTHLGCLFKWVPSNDRFECPCHGSKFQKTGEWIEGPAPRNLDRFVVQVFDASGSILAETMDGDADQDAKAGGALPISSGAAEIAIDTGKRILGAQHP